MATNNTPTKIDTIIDGWHRAFGELKSYQEKGGAVSAQDVNAILQATGKSIYESGLTLPDVVADGHKAKEFEKIYASVSKPTTAIAGGQGENPSGRMKVNFIQLAALENTDHTSHRSMLQAIEYDPTYIPPMIASREKLGTPKNPGNKLPSVMPDITKQAVSSAGTILDKIAPPDNLTSSQKPRNNPLYSSNLPLSKPDVSTSRPVTGGSVVLSDGQLQPELTQMPVRIIRPTKLPTNNGPI